MSEPHSESHGGAKAPAAERSSLREFQARLTERLKMAGSSATQSARLGLSIGDRRMLVELSEAGEIVALPGTMAPVPLTHDWFRGLVNLRGSLYAVSDLARFGGGERTPITKDTRLVSFAARLKLNGAILVDRMLGLQNLDAMQPGPEADAPAASWLGRDWIDKDGMRWTELSLSKLATDERYLAVAR